MVWRHTAGVTDSCSIIHHVVSACKGCNSHSEQVGQKSQTLTSFLLLNGLMLMSKT